MTDERMRMVYDGFICESEALAEHWVYCCATLDRRIAITFYWIPQTKRHFGPVLHHRADDSQPYCEFLRAPCESDMLVGYFFNTSKITNAHRGTFEVSSEFWDEMIRLFKPQVTRIDSRVSDITNPSQHERLDNGEHED